jgi:Protein of unknown function (DUF3168)
MNAESIIESLLNVPAVTALVGNRIALEEIPQGDARPYLIYRIVSDVGMKMFCRVPNTYRARVQISPYASTVTVVNQIHSAARAAIESDTERIVATRRFINCRFESIGPLIIDDFSGLWTKPIDYMMYHE